VRCIDLYQKKYNETKKDSQRNYADKKSVLDIFH